MLTPRTLKLVYLVLKLLYYRALLLYHQIRAFVRILCHLCLVRSYSGFYKFRSLCILECIKRLVISKVKLAHTRQHYSDSVATQRIF